MVSKAIQLELVTYLTTNEAFIASLKRFFDRRGNCSKLFSDNAKIFVGANNDLKRLYNIFNKSNEI